MVNADKLKEAISNATATSADGSISLSEIVDFIDNAETVDAVPVVRCKDCGVWKRLEDGLINCPYCTDLKTPDDFCSYGEK
jgi:hypothetical protein